MAYILRTEDGYKLYYDEPVYEYVVYSNGSMDSYENYLKDEEEETCIEWLGSPDYDLCPRQGWSDVSNNNYGINITEEMVEYLIGSWNEMEVNTYLEIITKKVLD